MLTTTYTEVVTVTGEVTIRFHECENKVMLVEYFLTNPPDDGSGEFQNSPYLSPSPEDFWVDEKPMEKKNFQRFLVAVQSLNQINWIEWHELYGEKFFSSSLEFEYNY